MNNPTEEIIIIFGTRIMNNHVSKGILMHPNSPILFKLRVNSQNCVPVITGANWYLNKNYSQIGSSKILLSMPSCSAIPGLFAFEHFCNTRSQNHHVQ